MKNYFNEYKEKVIKEKPMYFVSVKGSNLFESHSITECKKELLKAVKNGLEQEGPDFCSWEYFIGMFSIDLI